MRAERSLQTARAPHAAALPIAIALVVERGLLREALRELLAREADLEVVGDGPDWPAACACAPARRPRVVVADSPRAVADCSASMRGRAASAARILAIGSSCARHAVHSIVAAGADGYALDSISVSELAQAIRSLAAGHGYFSPQAARALAEHVAREPSRSLGARERTVLRLIAEGSHSREIAGALGITVATVEVHRRNLMRKLDLHSVAKLTRYAVREGLVPP